MERIELTRNVLILVLCGIAMIGGLECLAMIMGVNGKLLGMAIGAIASLVAGALGFTIKQFLS